MTEGFCLNETECTAAAGEQNRVQIDLHRRLKPLRKCNETQPLKWGNTINIYFPWNNIKRRLNSPWPCLQCFHADVMVSNQFGRSRTVLAGVEMMLEPQNTRTRQTFTGKPINLHPAVRLLLHPTNKTADSVPQSSLAGCVWDQAWRSHCSPHVHPTRQPQNFCCISDPSFTVDMKRHLEHVLLQEQVLFNIFI